MRSTLFYIPHEIAGLTVLGLGWALLALVVGCVGWGAWCAWNKRPRAELFGLIPYCLVGAALVVFILPNIETRWPDGTVVGLPIRGYGVMVMLGMLGGIGITIHRGRRLGISPDLVVSLGFTMMIGGVLGARAFFVFQKWDSYAGLPFKDRLIDIVKVTEGGLVIYGGIIGGVLAGMWFCWRHRQPIRSISDLVAPGFLLGLAVGRVGCLLNGCCYGGVCTAELPTIRFPQGSLPYSQHLENGALLGIEIDSKLPPDRIRAVDPYGIAAKSWQTKVGDTLNRIDPFLILPSAGEDPARTPSVEAAVTINDHQERIGTSGLPQTSLPVHPSQIYASINALLLCLLIWTLQPIVKHDGDAFLLAIFLYACSRFLLELIRSDESGQFGTSLTIAQWIAFLSGIVSLALLVVLMRKPSFRAWQWKML